MYFIPRSSRIGAWQLNTSPLKRYAITGVLCLVFAATLRYIYVWLDTQIAQERTLIDELQQKKLTLARSHQEYENQDADIAHLKTLLKEKNAFNDQSAHLARMLHEAVTHGLTFNGYTCDKVVDKKLYQKIDIQSSFQGTLSNIGKFLNAFNVPQILMRYNQIALSHLKNDIYTLQCSMGFYSFFS